MQTLPSLLLQTCLIYQHGLLDVDVTAVPIGLAIAQLVMAGVTISLTTLVLSMPTSPAVSSSLKKCSTSDEVSSPVNARSGSFSGHQCLITAVRSICLLWCRTVAVGVFMTEFHVWTLIVFGVHWCIALLWLVLQDSASELQSEQATPSPAVSLFRRALVAYLLVFDWPPRYQPKHSGWGKSGSSVTVTPAAAAGSWLDVVGLGGEPRSVAVAIYYGISGVENAAMLSLWFHFAPPSALVPPVARLTTLATCTAALTLGVLCVVASTQGPDEETPSVSSVEAPQAPHATKQLPSISGTIGLLPPCTLVQQREVRTVVAQIHPVRSSCDTMTVKTARLTQAALTLAANHSHPIEPPPPPPPPPMESTWMECRDDESSNSRNTNTLDGGLMGSGSGGSCSSPAFNPGSSSPAVNMSTHPVAIRRSPAFQEPSRFMASQISQKPSLVKRPYLSSAQPTSSSTPRVGRQVKTERRRRRRTHHQHHNHQRSSCHCRLFDDYGIFIKENCTLKSTSSKTPSGQFRIMCAKCLGAHDPLLTTCNRSRGKKSGVQQHHARTLPSRHHQASKILLDTSMCSTTYPSDTEINFTRKSVSSSSSSSSGRSSTGSLDSEATYTTWPPRAVRVPSMERLLSENASPWNYVQAWLANANHNHHGRATVGRPSTTTRRTKTTKRLVPQQATYSSAYCTVPPRLGQSVKELSLVRRSGQKAGSVTAVIEHQYSTPVEIVV